MDCTFWKQETVIFCEGLKQRFLPLLTDEIPIHKIRQTKNFVVITRESQNQSTMDAVCAWVNNHPDMFVDRVGYHSKKVPYDKLIHGIIDILATMTPRPVYEYIYPDFESTFYPILATQFHIQSVNKVLHQAGLITKKRKRQERETQYYFQEIVHLHDDHSINVDSVTSPRIQIYRQFLWQRVMMVPNKLGKNCMGRFQSGTKR